MNYKGLSELLMKISFHIRKLTMYDQLCFNAFRSFRVFGNTFECASCFSDCTPNDEY